MRVDPAEPFAALWRHRSLGWQLLRRDIQQRTRGSSLGIVWSLLGPLSLLAIYTVVFSGLHAARPGAERAPSGLDVGLVVFAGLIPFQLVAEVATRAPGLVASVPAYVRRIVFPVDILAPVAVASALWQSLVALAVLLAAIVVVRGELPASALLLPLVYAPLLSSALALGWTLSASGVFSRDVAPGIGIATQALFFLTPIVYPEDLVPERWRFLLHAHPLTPVVQGFRGVLLGGPPPSWGELGLWSIASLVAALVAHGWFRRVSRKFADAL